MANGDLKMMLLILVLFSLFFNSNAEKQSQALTPHEFDSLLTVAWDKFDYRRESSRCIANELNRHIHSIDDIRKFKLLYLLGHICLYDNYLDLSAKYYFEAYDILKGKKDEKSLERKMYLLQNLGVVYERTFDYATSLKYFDDAIEIGNELGHENLELLFHNKGVIQRKQELYSGAKISLNKASELNSVSNNFHNRSKIYNELGNIHHHNREYKTANSFYTIAVNSSLKNKINESEISVYQSNLGENYFLQDQYDSAKIYYHQALEISEKFNDTEKMKWIYSNIGDVHFKEKNYHEAIAWYQKSIELGNRDAIDSELQRALQNISEAYKNLGLYREAAESLSEYIDQFAMLHEKAKTLTEQNAQYKLGEVEWQLKLAEEESKTSRNKLIFLSIIMAISLLTIVGSFRKPR